LLDRSEYANVRNFENRASEPVDSSAWAHVRGGDPAKPLRGNQDCTNALHGVHNFLIRLPRWVGVVPTIIFATNIDHHQTIFIEACFEVSASADGHDSLATASVAASIPVCLSVDGRCRTTISVVFDNVHFHAKRTGIIIACLDVAIVWKIGRQWRNCVEV